MQVQYINFFTQAKQYRTTNPIASGIVLLLILLLLPVVIVFALGALAAFMVYAQVKTFMRSLTRKEGQPRIKITQTRKPQEVEYAQYEIIEEHRD